MPPATRDKTKAFLIVLGIVLVGLLIFVASPAYREANYLLRLPDPFWRFRCLPTLSESKVSSITIEITPWMKQRNKFTYIPESETPFPSSWRRCQVGGNYRPQMR